MFTADIKLYASSLSSQTMDKSSILIIKQMRLLYVFSMAFDEKVFIVEDTRKLCLFTLFLT
jgi:hypothetical protein